MIKILQVINKIINDKLSHDCSTMAQYLPILPSLLKDSFRLQSYNTRGNSIIYDRAIFYTTLSILYIRNAHFIIL